MWYLNIKDYEEIVCGLNLYFNKSIFYLYFKYSDNVCFV